MSFMRRKTVNDIELKNKRVLLRVDFNVPLTENKIANNHRIMAATPTIKYLLEREAKAVVLISHLGSPNGQRNERFSLKVIVEELQKLLDRDVVFVNECMGPDVDNACANPDYGSVILLENLRFHIEEEGQIDEEGRKIRVETSALRIFRDSLSKLGDVYVNDALTSAHRPHSSITGIAIETRVAGLLMKKELESFVRVFDKPATPFLAIFGGSRIVDKINVIEYLLEKVTDLIVVGAPAFTFLKVIQKMEIGKSLYDEEGAKAVPRLMDRAKANKVNVILPTDFVTADRYEEKALVGRSKIKDGIRGEYMGLDIGQETVKKFQPIIMKAKTVIWNGPPGVFEWENFAKGTEAIVALLASATKKGTFTLLGGEDTALAAEKFKAINKFSHVSTGGEATLELLEGKELPGITHLTPIDPNQMKM